MLSHVLRKARPQSARIQQISRSLASLPWETSVSHDIATPERSNKNPVPSFNDTQSAYESKSNFELVRAAACFTISRIPILITYSEVMLRAARYISPSVTDALMRVTFYGHFCAGEDQVRIQPVIKMLDNFGVGNILDYAAESDEPSTPTPKSTPSAAPNHNQLSSELSTPVAREYDYESEAKCDQHVDVFMQCINDVASGSKDGYAAIKVTALGNPKLLTRMSQAITEAKRLFEKFDDNMDGYVTREEFELSFK
jgi:proline dehydrogenase